jgi:geranylgeranyl pyrophosphate synthase
LVKYETNYEQEVAGPYDREFTLAFKKEMVEEDWFQQEVKVSLNRFVPGNNVGKLEKEFAKYFRNKGKEIRFVLQLFQDKTLEESELIATLYAVWNNRLIRKEPIDISDLIEDVYKWSERKAIYSAEEITVIHSWMMEKGLVPTGFGKEITRASN